jgi:uncharacterized protein YceK
MSDYGNNAEVGGNLTVTGSSTFNQDSADVNFIVETDDSDRTLWIDGANNNVGIGCAPSGSGNTTLLSVSGTTKIGETLYVDTVSSLSDTDTYITLGAEGNHIKFYVNGAEYMNISSGDGVEIAQYGGHLGDTDTYFNFSSDKLELVCGAKSMQTWVEAAQDQIIVNEDGNDIDFRVGSLHEPNMLFVEGSTNRVGIGTNAPDCRLHVTGTTGDIFKLENTTAYGVTYGQLVKADLTIAVAGSSPIDTTLDLPAGAILDTLIVKLTTVGVVSSGTDYQLTNITLDNGLTTETMFRGFSSEQFSLIGDGSSIVSGTMYYFNNIEVWPPAGGVGYLWTAGTQDIKLNFSDANVTTDAIMDVAVYYRKFDLVR